MSGANRSAGPTRRAAWTTRLVGWGMVAAGVAGLSRVGLAVESPGPMLALVGLMGLMVVEGVVLVGSIWSEARADGAVEVGDFSVEGDDPGRSVAIGGVASAATSIDGSAYRGFVGLAEGQVAAGRPARGRGAGAGNPRLLGRVVMASIFVGKDGRSWTDREVAAGHDALERSAEWLEGEARLRSVPLRVGIADVFFRADDFVDEAVGVAYGGSGDEVAPAEIDADIKAVAMASRCAARLGFRDLRDLCSTIEGRMGGEVDAVAWLVHLKRAGQSLAILADARLLDGVGLAVCFAAESSFAEPLRGPARVDPVTVVHEMLHLFGASDTYNVPIDRFDPGTVTGRDVMRLDRDRLSEMIVGDLTAREVGWGRFGPRTRSPRRPDRDPRRKKKPGPRRWGRGPGRVRPGEVEG